MAPSNSSGSKGLCGGLAGSKQVKICPEIIPSKVLKLIRGPWKAPTLHTVAVPPHSAVGWSSMQWAQTGVAEGLVRVEMHQSAASRGIKRKTKEYP
jgi:hypothetical protein